MNTQAALLRRLLREACQTEWGRRYDFGALAQASDVIAAYQSCVPLHAYDDFAPDILRLRQGARDIIWPGRIRNFAVSSGTTSGGRILPLSREAVRRNAAFSFGVAFQYLRTTHNLRILPGRQISIPGLVEEDTRYPGTLIGEVSGFLPLAVGWPFRLLYRSVPREIVCLPNWQDKLRAIADYALHKDVRVIATVPSWAVPLFKAAISRHNAQRGTAVRTVGEIWPNLQLIITGGVALREYRAVLQELIGLPDVHFLETYGASEGFFSYQVELDDPAMLLDLDNGVFFEFVRFDGLDSTPMRRCHIGEVEAGVRYMPYVTTCSGLWTYPVGDVIRFTSIDPHKIEVVGRTSEVLDRYGEKVFGEDARHAMAAVCKESGAYAAEYHVTSRPPTTDTLPRLEWLIEFATPPADMDRFAIVLDAALCKINRHYHIRRESKAFDAPLVTAVRPGTFGAWLQRSRRMVSAQTKVQRMSEDTAVADALISLARGTTAPSSL